MIKICVFVCMLTCVTQSSIILLKYKVSYLKSNMLDKCIHNDILMSKWK